MISLHTVAEERKNESNDEDNTSNTGTVGGVIGAILGFVAVLTVTVGVVVVFVRRIHRQRRRELTVNPARETVTTEGFMNGAYGGIYMWCNSFLQ